MYMARNKEFVNMMQGGFGRFTQYEVWLILSHQNELRINTLSIQKMNDGYFICCVDEFTTKEYKREV